MDQFLHLYTSCLCYSGIALWGLPLLWTTYKVAWDYLAGSYLYCIVLGGSSVPRQLCLNAGWLDWMGLSEIKHKASQKQRHDPGCAGLPHVASFWSGKYKM